MEWRHRTTRTRTLHNNIRLDKSGERRKRLERPWRSIRGKERVREASTLSLSSYYLIGAPGTNHLVLAAPIQVANAKCKCTSFSPTPLQSYGVDGRQCSTMFKDCSRLLADVFANCDGSVAMTFEVSPASLCGVPFARWLHVGRD